MRSKLMSSACVWVAVAAALVGVRLLGAHAGQPPADGDVAALQEQAMRAAVLRVSPSLAQIETSGGADLVGNGPQGPNIRKGVGPTTGLVVATDGYIISSSFNFTNKPTAIFVSVPGHKERFPAKVVAKDETRMLTLLKIEAKGLAVPLAAPKKEIKIGQTALAVGRTWGSPESFPSVSEGIVSALGRIWGKAIQTDAKVSPVNYGGPLVDVQGRVLGVLVPASPHAQDETAGVEWYDSGIGFAIPMEDVNAVLPRLRLGQDLKRGLLGINFKNQDIYGGPPAIDNVLPNSAAARIGIKAGDILTEIAGVKTGRQAQVMHALGGKYEGDVVSVKVRRGKEEVSFPSVQLTGAVTAYTHPFLGVLALRDDPELGVEIRHVFPKSPAEAAGLKVGDRILTLGLDKGTPKPFSGRDELMKLLNSLIPGVEVKMEVRRKASKELSTVTLKLADMSDAVPDKLPEPASLKKALAPRKQAGPISAPMNAKPEKKDPKKKPETGLIKRTNAAGDHEYWIYVPENYDPNIAYGLVIWLHPAGQSKPKDIDAVVSTWEDFCKDNHLILLGPKAQNDTGWLASESEFVQDVIKEVVDQYTIDGQRVVAHGRDVGGQLAFYLAFHARDLIRGVAVTGSVLNSQPAENLPAQRLYFFVTAGGKDPLVKSIAEAKPKLVEKKFPVVYREIADMGHQYLDESTLQELVRWIDSLDRL